MSDLLKSLFTESNVLAAIGFVVGVAVFAYRSLSKQSEELKARRLGDVLAFSQLAYKVVAEIAIRTPTKIDDKLALGLQKLNEALQAAGKPTLTDAEAKLAALAFAGQHGDEKLAEKLSELAAPIVPSPVVQVNANPS